MCPFPQLTVKGDVATQYKILLQGLITSEQRTRVDDEDADQLGENEDS